MALQQPESVLISLASKIIKGDADLNGLYCQPGAMVSSEARLLLRTISGPAVLPQLGSVLISTACSAAKGYVDVQGLGHNLWPCWHPRAMPLPGPC